jgi:hypothetical protein
MNRTPRHNHIDTRNPLLLLLLLLLSSLRARSV